MNIINRVVLILFVSLAASNLFAQSAEIDTFVRKVEGAGTLAAAVQSRDGGYVTVSGKIYYATSFVVRKMEASGEKQWEKTLNFKNVTYIRAIAQTTDGGYVLAGFGCKDVYCLEESGTILVKLRANGSLAWNHTLVLIDQEYTLFQSVIATSDGGVFAIGTFDGFINKSFSSRLLVVRFGTTGNIAWIKSLEGTSPKLVSFATKDNGFIVAARTGNSNPNGVDVMKITDSGIIVWRKSLSADNFIFQSGGISRDNRIILVGNVTDSNMLKAVVLDAGGTLIWKAGYFLKVKEGIESVSNPIQTPDGGFILTGNTYDKLAKRYSGFIAKIDTSRKVEFQNTFDSEQSFGESIFANADGSYLLFGDVKESLLISKMNSKGIAGCGFFSILGATTNTSFGPLAISRGNTIESDALSIAIVKSPLNSSATNHPVTTICQ
jgi:hypothetical protein